MSADDEPTRLELRRLLTGYRMSRWADHVWPIGDAAAACTGVPLDTVIAVLDAWPDDQPPPTRTQLDVAFDRILRAEQIRGHQLACRALTTKSA